jgi:hypothetical protein
MCTSERWELSRLRSGSGEVFLENGRVEGSANSSTLFCSTPNSGSVRVAGFSGKWKPTLGKTIEGFAPAARFAPVDGECELVQVILDLLGLCRSLMRPQ